MPARYRVPSQQANSVMSATQRRSGAVGGEVPSEQIRCRCGVRAAATPFAAAVHTDQTLLGHQPSHPLAAHPPAPVPQLAVDPWCPVGALRRPMNVDDLVGQDGIVEITAATEAGGATRSRWSGQHRQGHRAW